MWAVKLKSVEKPHFLLVEAFELRFELRDDQAQNVENVENESLT